MSLLFSILVHKFQETNPRCPDIEVPVVKLTSRDAMRLENKPDVTSHLEGLTSSVQNVKVDHR